MVSSAPTAPAASRPSSAPPPRGRAAASPVPLGLGAAALAVSIALAVWVLASLSAEISFLGVPLRLVVPDAWWVSLIGYLLTPMVTVACYGWDAVAQRAGRRRNRNFVERPGFSRALIWIVAAGVVVGAWHALNLSVPLTEALGWS